VYSEWEKLIEERAIPATIAVAGQTISLGEAEMNIIYPFEDLTGQTVTNLNNSSIVGHLIFGKTSFLLTGDAEKEAEGLLLSQVNHEKFIESNVLKVGHHGSKTASTVDFVKAVHPEVAVISAGRDNKFKHPHQSTLNTFEDLKIKVLRTDKDGDIGCSSDGSSVQCGGI
jgi:competence protein ComEC